MEVALSLPPRGESKERAFGSENATLGLCSFPVAQAGILGVFGGESRGLLADGDGGHEYCIYSLLSQVGSLGNLVFLPPLWTAFLCEGAALCGGG